MNTDLTTGFHNNKRFNKYKKNIDMKINLFNINNRPN